MMDVELILKKLESMNFVRLKKRVGNYMTCYCPFHNDGNEKKPSCGVLLVDEYKGNSHYPAGWWHCFSCGYAKTMPEAIEDLLKMHNITQSGLEWLKSNIPGFSLDVDFDFLIPKELMNNVTGQFALEYIKQLEGTSQKYVSEEELATYRYIVPYMYERKLTDDIIIKFDVGFDAHFRSNPKNTKETPCLTFPVKDINGNVLFIYRRSIQGRFHNYPEGVLKPVYGIDQIPKGCRSVIICESIINALTCWVYGYVAVALMGTGNSYQIQQLKELGVSEFIICLDGDDAGRKGTAKLKRALSSIALIWVMHIPENEDVNSITRETFDKVYNERD